MAPMAEDQTFLYRLNVEQWHCLVPLTDFVIIHETTTGPFKKDESDFPDWASDEKDKPAIRKFIQKITE
jgi:hypothetical protein